MVRFIGKTIQARDSKVSLVVTDEFKGIDQIISQVYPLVKQLRCLIHISRNLASKVKRADRAVILE